MKPKTSQRILLVADFNRADFIYPATILKQEIDFFFIDHVNKNYLTNKECLNHGEVLYWSDYQSAFDLLNQLSPDKVVFYFIQSFNQVALNVACKVTGTPSIHLEHGIRFSAEYYKNFFGNSPKRAKKRRWTHYLKMLNEFWSRYRSRRFYWHTVSNCPAQPAEFLKKFHSVRQKKNGFDTLQELRDDLRLPHKYISFSEKIFASHQELEQLPHDFPVSFIGIPQFDQFYRLNASERNGQDVLFIDQPMSDEPRYGWNRQIKNEFLREVTDIITKQNRRFLIKPHPRSDMKSYDEVIENDQVEIVSNNDWETVVPSINCVLGFFSTLLMPFMAMKGVSCFAMEVHPRKVDPPHSKFLTDSGTCEPVFSFADLESKLSQNDNWISKQDECIEIFLEKWMHSFDGMASDRLCDELRKPINLANQS